jgi:hypothetical protein
MANAIRYDPRQQVGLVRDQPIDRLGGHAGALRHGSDTRAGVAVRLELLRRRRLDQQAACLFVGAYRRTSARSADLLCNLYHDHFPNLD